MKTAIFILYLLFIPTALIAQSFKVYPIPNLNQLPVSSVHKSYQDSEGYVWYGTVNGLCRDDGYQIKVFRSDFKSPYPIKDNYVQCISEDKEQKIWFGTNHGAYILNKKGYTITPIDSVRLSQQQVRDIWSSSDGFMWLSIHGSLLKYDSKGKFIKSYPMQNWKGQPTFVNGFCESRQKDIWITLVNAKIHRYEKDKDKFSVPTNFPEQYDLINIIQDFRKDYFWIGTWYSGLIKFDPWASKEKMYKSYPLPHNTIGNKDATVIFVAQDHYKGYLWTTTHTDLMVMQYDEKKDILQQTDLDILTSSCKMLNQISLGKEGNLWVTAFDSPSFIIRHTQDSPQRHPLPAIQTRTNFTPTITYMCDAGENLMWLSQERVGLLIYDLQNDKLSFYYDFNNLKHHPLHAIKYMTSSHRKGYMWLIPENTNTIYEFSHNSLSMSLEQCISLPSSAYTTLTRLYESHKGILWIGTDTGLISYSLQNKSAKIVNDTLGHVSSIVESPDGTLWISTFNKGIYKINDNKITQHFHISESISCSAISNQQIWIGTTSGKILSLNIQNGTFTDYTERCGMNGDIINELLTDVYGHLWIGTNQRIIEYNPQNDSHSSFFTTNKDIAIRRFLPGANCLSLSGKIYFGGISGICEFTPSNKLDQKSRNPQTLITDICIENQSIFFAHNQNTAESIKKVILNPEEQELTIYFSTLDFLNAKQIRYAYRLKGLQDKWSFTNFGENSVTYKHLPKGNFTFEVKATDEYGIWSHEITTLPITHLPAFYETWWAFFLYIIIICSMIATLLIRKLRLIYKKNEELYSDSIELIKMRNYLQTDTSQKEKEQIEEITVSDIEFKQLDDILLNKILKIVEENLSEPDFDVVVLAEKINMSSSSLTRKLKAITGLTPLEYIKKIKLKHAQRLLEDPHKTVAEVALTLGYFNRKYFTACFKKEFGITPSEYQKSLHKVENPQNRDTNQ